MLDAFRQNIANRQLLSPGERIVVAVSGGLDSMVLLDCLRPLDLQLGVAHFNHQLRGPESDGDEAFVRDRAGKLALPFFFGSGDVKAHAAERGVSIEMAARELRHAFLASAAREFGACKIALAHNADDQVETFWLRLLRGNVGEGLAGMRWLSPSPADPALNLIRPLLDIPRAEILAFAQKHRIQFREDSSNSDLHFQRNRIRREILPLLERFQPRLREITLRAAEVLGAEKDLLRELATTASYAGAHPAIQREIIRRQLLENGVPPTFDLIESLRDSTRPISVAPGKLVRRQPDGTILARSSIDTEFSSETISIDITEAGRIRFADNELAWTYVPSRGPAEPNTEYFDADALGRTIILRYWRPGDRYRPIGMPEPVKLQDIFTNLKVPITDRHERLLAATEAGDVFWVEGLRIGEIAKTRPNTLRILRWTCRSPDDSATKSQ